MHDQIEQYGEIRLVQYLTVGLAYTGYNGVNTVQQGRLFHKSFVNYKYF